MQALQSQAEVASEAEEEQKIDWRRTFPWRPIAAEESEAGADAERWSRGGARGEGVDRARRSSGAGELGLAAVPGREECNRIDAESNLAPTRGVERGGEAAPVLKDEAVREDVQ